MTPQYQRQLDYIFNRPTDEPAWYWRTDSWEEDVFNDNSTDAFIFLETLFSNAERDLKPYSDDQIGLGLNYIFNNACSNLVDDFKAAAVPFDRKIKAIQSLFDLFQGVLNVRCAPILSASSQITLSKIQFICYMFWDITPLSMWASSDENEVKMYYKTIADVMKKCLRLSNPACVESGLHGLGHIVYGQPKIAVPIIDNFLKKGKYSNENLINYAKMARTGMIP
jgi:hypothetical protein